MNNNFHCRHILLPKFQTKPQQKQPGPSSPQGKLHTAVFSEWISVTEWIAWIYDSMIHPRKPCSCNVKEWISVFKEDSKTNFRNISLVPPTGVTMSPAERVTDERSAKQIQVVRYYNWL